MTENRVAPEADLRNGGSDVTRIYVWKSLNDEASPTTAHVLDPLRVLTTTCGRSVSKDWTISLELRRRLCERCAAHG